MISLMWNLRNKEMKKNKQKRQKHVHKYREQTRRKRVGWGIGKMGGGQWEVQASSCCLSKSQG